VQPFLDAIPDVRSEVFADSSHMPHVEEEERYLAVVGAFLDASDRSSADSGPAAADRSLSA
jgi:L-proline amide hydrolase